MCVYLAVSDLRRFSHPTCGDSLSEDTVVRRLKLRISKDDSQAKEHPYLMTAMLRIPSALESYVTAEMHDTPRPYAGTAHVTYNPASLLLNQLQTGRT